VLQLDAVIFGGGRNFLCSVDFRLAAFCRRIFGQGLFFGEGGEIRRLRGLYSIVVIVIIALLLLPFNFYFTLFYYLLLSTFGLCWYDK